MREVGHKLTDEKWRRRGTVEMRSYPFLLLLSELNVAWASVQQDSPRCKIFLPWYSSGGIRKCIASWGKEGRREEKKHVWGCSSFLCPFSHFAFINSVASKEMLSGWEFVVTHSNMNALTIIKSICFFHQYSAGSPFILIIFFFRWRKKGGGELKRKVSK